MKTILLILCAWIGGTAVAYAQSDKLSDEKRRERTAVRARAHRHETQRGEHRSHHDVRRAPAPAVFAGLVRKRAEERQHEERHDIVERHNDAAQRVIEPERIRQDLGNDVVVHLPEHGDAQKHQSHEKRVFNVEFHVFSSLSDGGGTRLRRTLFVFIVP